MVYMNGTVSRLRTGNSKAIEPGCEIIVPSKDPKKRMSAAEIIGMGTFCCFISNYDCNDG